MRRSLLSLAAIASFAVSGAAMAQSSVTLYGVVDAGITYQSNVGGKSQWSLGSGIDQSYVGLRGAEDLGGGLKTIFTLESGFNIGNGQFQNNGGFFNRQAFVGVESNYGTVTLGRQYDATQDYLAPLSATGSWGGTYFAHPGNIDNLSTNGGYALNNSIKFTSANYSGLQFGGTYSFSNNQQFASNRAYSLGAQYQNQGIHAGVAYSQANNPGAYAGGANDNGNSYFAYPDGLRVRTFGAGAGYTFGQAQVNGVWTQTHLDNAAGFGSQRLDNYEVNARYNLSPALGLGAAYTYSHTNGNSDSAHWNQFGLQADYSLSKRTDVYAQAVYQNVSKGQNDDVLGAGIYNGNNATPLSTSDNQTAVTVGLRHRF